MDAQKLKSQLMAAGLSNKVASAIVGNSQVETDNFKAMRPYDKTENSYGLFHWNGPRLRDFKAHADSLGLPIDSDEANVSYFLKELQDGKHVSPNLIRDMEAAPDVGAAAVIFRQQFERPRVPNDRQRVNYAQQAMSDDYTAPRSVVQQASYTPKSTVQAMRGPSAQDNVLLQAAELKRTKPNPLGRDAPQSAGQGSQVMRNARAQGIEADSTTRDNPFGGKPVGRTMGDIRGEMETEGVNAQTADQNVQVENMGQPSLADIVNQLSRHYAQAQGQGAMAGHLAAGYANGQQNPGYADASAYAAHAMPSILQMLFASSKIGGQPEYENFFKGGSR